MSADSTVAKAWFVCQQFFSSGHRFKTLEEAEAFTRIMAKKHPCTTFEIFECVQNVIVDLPVTTVKKE